MIPSCVERSIELHSCSSLLALHYHILHYCYVVIIQLPHVINASLRSNTARSEIHYSCIVLVTYEVTITGMYNMRYYETGLENQKLQHCKSVLP